MTVTKQQQLEWLAENGDCWPGFMDREVRMCAVMLGRPNQGIGYHTITKQEWQQERDKMSSKPEFDNSWHERGELPPAGHKCVLYAAGNNGEEVTFIGVTSDSYPVFETSDKRVLLERGKYEFRPIRTEREKAIDEIAALVSCGLVSHEMAREFAVNMYDAGLKVVKR